MNAHKVRLTTILRSKNWYQYDQSGDENEYVKERSIKVC